MSSGFIVAMVFAVIVLMVGVTISQHFFSKQKKDEQLKRIMEAGGKTESEAEDEQFIESLRSETEPSGLAIVVTGIMASVGIDVDKFREKNQIRFYQAGLHSPDAPVMYFLYTRVVSVLVVIGIGFYIFTRENPDMIDYIVTLITVVIAVFGADIWVKNLTEKRKQVLQRSFPDVLDLLLACVESGLALDGALLRVCKELGSAHPMMTDELNRLRVELSLLNDRSQALTNFSERNGLLSFRLFVTALLQSEKFGTSLTDTLRVMAEDYRTQRLMRAEEKAGRLPALITMPLIIFLLPALFLIILGPAAITAFANIAGK